MVIVLGHFLWYIYKKCMKCIQIVMEAFLWGKAEN